MALSMSRCLLPSHTVIMVLAIILGFGLLPAWAAAQSPVKSDATESSRLSMVMPLVDASKGRRLFVTKGCFMCHAVNGVGGKAAVALDAAPGSKTIDVVGFIARLWRGAPIMFELQSMELGYRIEFSADEFADLAGFIGIAKAQEGFSQGEIPELVKDWKIDKAWWKDPSIDDWRSLLPKEFPDIESNTP